MECGKLNFNIIKKLKEKIKNFYPASLYSKKSFSQCGEDIIIDFIFSTILKIKTPSYIDIGAHHPFYLSNTYYFYLKGSKGICVEPDPYLFRAIKQQRPNDICLNVGVGTDGNIDADFYVMSTKTLNTFSQKDALRYVSECNQKIEQKIKMKLVSVNEIISKNLNVAPNFISLDVEGMDFEIIKSFDFNRYRPEVFCIETLTYSETNNAAKIMSIIEFMKSKSYFVYADTNINTIFVDKKTGISNTTSLSC